MTARRTIFSILAISLAVAAPARAQQSSPSATLTHVVAKSGAETPSGFKVPRFVSLKYGNINGRTGPGQSHPVKWNYTRKGLPVIIVAETEMWRKVRDTNGDESWMHKRTLSGERTAITLADVTVRAKPGNAAKGRAIVSKDALLALEKCDDAGWCAVKAPSGHRGWVQRRFLWGAQTF